MPPLPGQELVQVLGKELGPEPQGEVLALPNEGQEPEQLALGLEPHLLDHVPHVGTPGNSQGHSRMGRTWTWSRRHPVGPRRNRRTQEQRLERRTCGMGHDGSLGRHPQEQTSGPPPDEGQDVELELLVVVQELVLGPELLGVVQEPQHEVLEQARLDGKQELPDEQSLPPERSEQEPDRQMPGLPPY